MKAIAKIRITHVKEMLSQRGEVYHTITGTEDTGIPNGQGGNHSRIWENLYCPKDATVKNPDTGAPIEPINLKALENCNVDVVVNFYPVMRTVGDKNFTDIKCNIIGFK